MTFKFNALTPDVLKILKEKSTEKPFSGKYHDHILEGSYLCRGCGSVLFRGNNQFHSGCGWPSFDEELSGKISRVPDIDGMRTEIVCSKCKSHLGHVFTGEQFTAKNTRHCVNSLSLEFIEDNMVLETDEAVVGGGCFWGVQHLFNQLPGVLRCEVGYTDGITAHPTYQQVCSHATYHIEAIRIIFDTQKISYESIIRYFFEIHDFTQEDGQGPDRGSQYLSRVFYFNDEQKNIAEKIKQALITKGFSVATAIKPISIFWAGEEYHQDYYKKNNQVPYCHYYRKRF